MSVDELVVACVCACKHERDLDMSAKLNGRLFMVAMWDAMDIVDIHLDDIKVAIIFTRN